jgi:triacylglycerol lipase
LEEPNMKTFLTRVAAATFLFFAGAGTLSAGALDGQCIALVHGILGFDDRQGPAPGLLKYWGGVDQYLRSQGAKVLTPGSSAAGSIQTRSGQTLPLIQQWMATNGCSKVHLIGHSQGGLVIRYIASPVGSNFGSKVATVTSVNSLHKGAPMSDIVLGVIPSWLQPFANVALSSFLKLIYRDGKTQDVIAMGKSLAVSELKIFSPKYYNASGVKYYSYGSKMAWADPIQHPLMALTHPITWAGGLFYGLGSANDGVVPLESQKWGTWKGEPSSNWYATGIDHLQATNFEWSGQYYYDVNGHYLNIAKNAKAGL